MSSLNVKRTLQYLEIRCKQTNRYTKKNSEIQYRGKRIPWPYTKKKFRNLVQRQMNTIREEKTEEKGNKKAEINQEYQI